MIFWRCSLLLVPDTSQRLLRWADAEAEPGIRVSHGRQDIPGGFFCAAELAGSPAALFIS